MASGSWLLWGLLGLLYFVGWIRLRRQGSTRLASLPRAGIAGMAFGSALTMSLPSFEALVRRSFFLHMLEHEVFLEISPILLWMVRPIAFWLWGLPKSWRAFVTRNLLHPQSTWRSRLERVTRPRVVVPVYLLTITLWHLPGLHDATVSRASIHALERLSLSGIALLFWWMVLAAFPRWHVKGRSTLPLVYIIGAYAHNEILGLGLALIRRPVYSFYEQVSPPWGLSPLTDQALGGAMMWIPGEMIYAMVMMGLLMRLLDEPRPYWGVFNPYPEASSGDD